MCSSDLFAIPGSIHSPLSKGCHQLIRQGAKLVESAQDILEEIRLTSADVSTHVASANDSVNSVNSSSVANQLVEAAGHDPVSVDELVVRTGLSMADIQANLLELELIGRIEKLPGLRYQVLH